MPRTPGPPASGALFVSVYNDQQHFTYLDKARNLQDAWYGSVCRKKSGESVAFLPHRQELTRL